MSAGEIAKLHRCIREVLADPRIMVRKLMGKKVELVFAREDDANTWNALEGSPMGILLPDFGKRRKVSKKTAPHNCFFVHAGNKRFYYGRKYRETVLEGDE